MGSGYIVTVGFDGENQCVRESDGEVVDMSYCGVQEFRTASAVVIVEDGKKKVKKVGEKIKSKDGKELEITSLSMMGSGYLVTIGADGICYRYYEDGRIETAAPGECDKPDT
jgi:hypothetical protein